MFSPRSERPGIRKPTPVRSEISPVSMRLYEEPLDPEIRLPTLQAPPEELAGQVIDELRLREHHRLSPPPPAIAAAGARLHRSCAALFASGTTAGISGFRPRHGS